MKLIPQPWAGRATRPEPLTGQPLSATTALPRRPHAHAARKRVTGWHLALGGLSGLAIGPAWGQAAPAVAPPVAATAASAPALADAALVPSAASPSATSAPGRVPAPPADDPLPAAPPPDRLQVVDEFLDLHTGPGRGYPVVFSVPRGDWVRIEQRYTDWFLVRSSEGRHGWVPRAQMEKTLTMAGVRKTFRDVLLDDYLHRRVEAGLGWGLFGSEPTAKFWASYRLSETMSTEFAFSQVQGVYSGSTLWHLNLMNEPWVDQRLSPFFAVGMGKFNNVPNRSLVGNSSVHVKLANVSLGVRYYLSERFVLRLDTSTYTAFVSDTRSGEYRAYGAGLSFFF